MDELKCEQVVSYTAVCQTCELCLWAVLNGDSRILIFCTREELQKFQAGDGGVRVVTDFEILRS